MLAGVNNLQGEIYYHAGLMHSPFHLPFGINLVGDWRHPFLRFGGKELKDGREREIASNLKDDVEVNIMQRLKHGWLEFVASPRNMMQKLALNRHENTERYPRRPY